MFYSKAHAALAPYFLESAQKQLKEKFFESRKQYQSNLYSLLNKHLHNYLHLLNIAYKRFYISELGKLIQQRNEILRVSHENHSLHATYQGIWQSLPNSHEDKDRLGVTLKLLRPDPLAPRFEAENRRRHQLYQDLVNDLINNQGKGFYELLKQNEGKKRIPSSSPKKSDSQKIYPFFGYIDEIEILFKKLFSFHSPRKIDLEKICEKVNNRFKNHPQISSPQLSKQERYILFYAKALLKTTLTLKKPTLGRGIEDEPIEDRVLNIKAARSQLAEYSQEIMPLEQHTDDEDWTVVDGLSM